MQLTKEHKLYDEAIRIFQQAPDEQRKVCCCRSCFNDDAHNENLNMNNAFNIKRRIKITIIILVIIIKIE